MNSIAPGLRTEYPLEIRDKIERLWRMAFGPVFPAPFSKAFSTVSAAAISWWLSGGIPASNGLQAYDAKNAASLALSYNNLAAPGNGLPDGTYDLSSTVPPAWANGMGWTFTAALVQLLSFTLVNPKPLSFVARIKPTTSGITNPILGNSSATGSTVFYINSANKINLKINNASVLAGATSVTTEKVIGVTYSATGIGIAYLNGLSDGTNTNDRTSTTGINRIGRFSGSYFDGVIALVASYNIVLTPTQMLAVSNAMLTL